MIHIPKPITCECTGILVELKDTRKYASVIYWNGKEVKHYWCNKCNKDVWIDV